MSQSVYKILAEFKGASAIVGDFKRVQQEARQTTRVLKESSKAEKQAAKEAARAEREKFNEARQINKLKLADDRRQLREMVQAEKSAQQERKRLRSEDLANQRRYIQTLKKEESDLRDQRQRALKIAGVGAAGLYGVGKGVKISADFESSVVDLRLSIQRLSKDGRLDMQSLMSDMARFEDLGVRLGNRLPGSTEDMISMFTVLKQGGIDTKTVLDGAGESVANLAVLTRSIPKELAEPYAQLGQMYNLKAEDYTKSSELFLKLYRTVGLRPEMLIESAKYFQPRAGAPLGLKGMEGLQTSAELMGLLKRNGMEGSMAGTNLAHMMGRLTLHKKGKQQQILRDLSKDGIKLDFFDKQGKFVGIEGMLSQFEKFRKLSEEKRVKAFTDLFGEEGKGVATVLTDAGLQGLKQFRDEMAGVASSQQQINELMNTFNAKWESLTGTASNAAVRTFTPLMETLKPIVDLMNVLLAETEGFAKENPQIAKFATYIIGTGSAAMLAYGGFRTLTTGIKIWQLTQKIAGAETGLLTLLRTQRIEAGQTATAIESSGKRSVTAAKSLGGSIGGALTTALKATVVTFAIEALVSDLLDRGQSEIERRKAGAEIDDLQKQREQVNSSTGLSIEEKDTKIKELDREIGQKMVDKVGGTKTGGYLQNPSDFAYWLTEQVHGNAAAALKGKRGLQWFYQEGLFGSLKPSGVAERQFMDVMPKFQSGEQLKSFLDTLNRSGAYEANELEVLKSLAAQIYPQYAQAVNSVVTALNQSAEQIGKIEWNLLSKNNKGDVSGSTDGGQKSESVNSPPKQRFPLFKMPSRAIGGRVLSDGAVHLHRGEMIVPAHVTNGLKHSSDGSKKISVQYSPVISFPAEASQSTRAAFQGMLAQHRDEIIAMLDDKLKDVALGF